MNNDIVFITKSLPHYGNIQDTLKKNGKDYMLFYDESIEKCIDFARLQVRLGAKVIVATNYLQSLIMKEVDVPTVRIRRSGYSFVSVVKQALEKEGVDKVAIVSLVNSFDYGVAAEEARILYPDKVFTYYYDSKDGKPNVTELFAKLRTAKFSDIVCPSQLIDTANSFGLNSMYIPLPTKDIEDAITNAEYQLRVYEQHQKYADLLSGTLNMISEGVVLINHKGIILECNDLACQVLKMNRKDLIGEKCSTGSLSVFDLEQYLEAQTDIYGKIVEAGDELLLFSIHFQQIEDIPPTMVLTFDRTSQIQENEKKIRSKVHRKGNVANRTFSSIVGGSKLIATVILQAKRYAAFNSAVLIEGPSGSGKELFAQSIHNASQRSKGPFVVINCAALPESVLESLLFGYESGTFTGADKNGRPGLFEQAHGGTVFLDEVSEMPLSIQSRFLRVLQEKEVSRIGSSSSIPVDIRVLSATNRDMWKLIREGKFREDLYHRISTLILQVPSLSERPEDIPMLAQYFVRNYAEKMSLPIRTIDQDALDFLSSKTWTGNVRELNNTLERAMILSDNMSLTREDVRRSLELDHRSGPDQEMMKEADDPYKEFRSSDAADTPAAPADTKEEFEKQMIERALMKHQGSRSKTAAQLGISAATLWRKMKKYQISEK